MSAPGQQIFPVSSPQESSETLLIVPAFLALFNSAADPNPRHLLLNPSDIFLTTLPTHHMLYDYAKMFPLLMILAFQRPALVLVSPHVLHLTILLAPPPSALSEAPMLVLYDLSRSQHLTVPVSPFR